MKLQIKDYGGSKVIVLPTPFLKFHDAKVGDWLDLSDVVKVEKKKVRRK